MESRLPMKICRVWGEGGGQENIVRDERERACERENGTGDSVLCSTLKVCSSWSLESATLSIHLCSYIVAQGFQQTPFVSVQEHPCQGWT